MAGFLYQHKITNLFFLKAEIFPALFSYIKAKSSLGLSGVLFAE